MTPEQARFQAAMHRLVAARLTFQAAAMTASAAVGRLHLAWMEAERHEFEAHPDVQETVAQMRGFYGP